MTYPTHLFCLAASACFIAQLGHASPIAEVVCAPSGEMQARLERTQGVVRSAMGIQDPEQLMEVWTSPDGERWALVVAYAAGTSCIVAMGENWSDLSSGSD
jgi:hypothetical protein